MHHKLSCPLHSKNFKLLNENVKCTCGKHVSAVTKELANEKLIKSSTIPIPTTTDRPITTTV